MTQALALDFETALATFTTAINKDIEKYATTFDADHMQYSETDENAYFQPITMTRGKKNIKLITKGSVYCFIKIETGQIFKAAGWNAPAKGARASIFHPEDYEKCDKATSGWLYR